MKPQPYEVLTCPNSGSISIIRFYDKSLFERFAKKHLSHYSQSKNHLKFCHLQLGQEHEEEVLVEHLHFPELHFHAGQLNQEKVCSGIDSLIQNKDIELSSEDLWTHYWEESFSKAKSEKALLYLSKLQNYKQLYPSFLSEQKLIHPAQSSNTTETWIEGFEFIKKIKMVIVGPANAGKSSLFNNLCGKYKAIVSAQAGTTRDIIRCTLIIEGFEVELMDTAGFMNEKENQNNPIQNESEKASLHELQQADIVLAIHSPNTQKQHPQQILIYAEAKSDLTSKQSTSSGLHFSNTTSDGLETLIQEISKTVKGLKAGKQSLMFHPKLPKELIQSIPYK